MRRTVYLSLGSNIGQRAVNLEMAISAIEEHNLGRVIQVSSFYETDPVEVTDQPTFLNCAAEVETTISPQQFMRGILEIEREMGRRRTQAKGPRNIDIDILLFGNAVIDTPDLTVPHPSMHERRFVLQPLAEIAPDVQHPKLHKTVKQLRNGLQPGTQNVRKLASRS